MDIKNQMEELGLDETDFIGDKELEELGTPDETIEHEPENSLKQALKRALQTEQCSFFE